MSNKRTVENAEESDSKRPATLKALLQQKLAQYEEAYDKKKNEIMAMKIEHNRVYGRIYTLKREKLEIQTIIDETVRDLEKLEECDAESDSSDSDADPELKIENRWEAIKAREKENEKENKIRYNP